MTERELKNYTRGIAYQAVKFEDGEISGDELITVLEASFGEDVFKEARELKEKNKQKDKSK